jgi:prevent-host-death family protein
MGTVRQPGRRLHTGWVVPAGEFKQHCLKLMDEVAARRSPLLITKRGMAVARLVPVDEDFADPFGSMRGTVTYRGDAVASDADDWADSDA